MNIKIFTEIAANKRDRLTDILPLTVYEYADIKQSTNDISVPFFRDTISLSLMSPFKQQLLIRALHVPLSVRSSCCAPLV
jgi:hypothetical protein